MTYPDPTAQIYPQPAPPAPRRRRTLVIVAACAVVVLAVLAVVIVAAIDGGAGKTASSASPSPSWSPITWPTETPAAPPPTNASFALGDTISTKSTGGAGTSQATWTVTADKQYRRTPDGYQGPQNGIFYGIRVSVSVSEGSQYIFAEDFALIGPDGTAYQSTSSMYSFAGALNGTTLNAGQKVSGLVVFDVPPSALAGGKIELRPGGQALSNGQAYWALS